MLGNKYGELYFFCLFSYTGKGEASSAGTVDGSFQAVTNVSGNFQEISAVLNFRKFYMCAEED